MTLNRRTALKMTFAAAAATAFGFSRRAEAEEDAAQIRARLAAIPMDRKVALTNEEWRKILTPEQFAVMREAGHGGGLLQRFLESPRRRANTTARRAIT